MEIEKPGLKTIVIEGPINKINESKLKKINHEIKSGKHVFLFLFMERCGPCNMTKESWAKITSHLKKEHLSNSKIILAQIDKDYYGKLYNVGKEPMGFPTLRYITDKEIQEYEDAPLTKKDRSPESFAEWINIKVTPLGSQKFNHMMIRQNGGKGTRDHRSPNSVFIGRSKRRAGGKKRNIKKKTRKSRKSRKSRKYIKNI